MPLPASQHSASTWSFWRLSSCQAFSPSFPQQGRFMESIQAHALPAGDPSSQQPKKQSNKPPGGFKRKRTGCMTCRKRKIKCCERKPTCSNCEKAKRECVWVGGSCRVYLYHRMTNSCSQVAISSSMTRILRSPRNAKRSSTEAAHHPGKRRTNNDSPHRVPSTESSNS